VVADQEFVVVAAGFDLRRHLNQKLRAKRVLDLEKTRKPDGILTASSKATRLAKSRASLWSLLLRVTPSTSGAEH